MNILLATHHLLIYSGSEMVIFELTQALQAMGHQLTIATLIIELQWQKIYKENKVPIIKLLQENIEEKNFDLIWVQHAPVLNQILNKNLTGKKIIFSSLSPYEPLEVLPTCYQELSLILANSQETKDELVKQGASENAIIVFPNFVNSFSFELFEKNKKPKLKRILIVSNHLPIELTTTLKLLKKKKYIIEIVGLKYNITKIDAEFVSKFDLLITIGKTVQLGLAIGIPVYCYDHFGGPGYITLENLEINTLYNFSGRPQQRTINAHEIIREIEQNYIDVFSQRLSLQHFAKKNFCLEKNLCKIFDILEEKPSINYTNLQKNFYLSQRQNQYYIKLLKNSRAQKEELVNQESFFMQPRQKYTSIIKFLILSTFDKFNKLKDKIEYIKADQKYYPNFYKIIQSHYSIKPTNLLWWKKNNLLKDGHFKELTKKIKNKVADIIIPWYGDENIYQLLPAIYKHSDGHLGQIYLINDAYPDLKKTKSLQNFLVKKYPQIIYLENKENLGFVASANKGMKQAENDFVLLNSDTIPTADWLKEMIKIAHSLPNVASVTAMSNNATIFSLPKFLTANKDNNPEQTNNLLNKVNVQPAIEVDTGHGFCLYIKKSAYVKVGEFDAKVYGKGYGEENDWCYQAKLKGYRHFAATNAYVLHLEGQSFGHNKIRDELIANHLKILNQRFPKYDRDIQLFIAKNPFSFIQDSLIKLKNKTDYLSGKYDLVILHSDFYKVLGGVELLVKEQIEKKISEGIQTNFILFYFDKTKNRYTINIIYQKKLRQIYVFNVNDDPELILYWLTQVFVIREAVIQHLLKHSLRYDLILGAKNITTTLYIHDYYHYCQIPDLIVNHKFAGWHEKDNYWSKQYELHKFEVTDQDHWLHENRRLLQSLHLNQVIFNSQFTKNTLLHLLNIPDNKRYIIKAPL